jgi:hypothetical protein
VDWVKLASRYYLDQAIANVDADTEVLFTRSLAYAGDQETGGFVPAGMLPALCRRRRYEACADALVAVGLWLPARGGYQIRTWQEWQLELEAITRRRSADRERKRRERERENGTSRDTVNKRKDLEEGTEDQLSGMSRDMSAECPPPREERVRTTTSKDVVGDVRGDVLRLCSRLADRIEANGSKRPAVTSRWHDAARLMLDRDGRTESQVTSAIDWSQDHEFWRSNILSMPKLREKYDQLRLQAARTARPRENGTDDIFDRAMKRAQKRKQDDANGVGGTGEVRLRVLPPAEI